ncbi:cytochrome c3 family protein [Parerythrobacter aestuarii]|uniref:cytochrome c3 family protein n=1 Tax=Parerythrobacter aestuarii TaxID=3020909 RepID=UPI0024DE9E2E|nr:cytochrome c3 family protein [Parerythrobacter aestuarii]
MAFLIRTIDHTASGREIVREREIEKGALTIGRAAENDIHLPDLAVEQRHVTIEPAAGGKLAVESVGTLGFGLDGRTVTSASVDPVEGAELELGSSRLVIAQEDDGTIGITVRQAEGDAASVDVLRSFALASALPSKRALSWAFSLAILLVLLAVPVFTHLTRERIDSDYDEPGQVALDASWSTGSLSLAHHGLEDNCEACHVDAFVSVRDETCLSCHEETADHAEAPRIARGRAPFGTGDALLWKIAGVFGKEGPGACTTCHTEHEGPTRMEPASQMFCAECHDSLDTRLTDTALGNASDFGTAHPQFKPAVFTRLMQEDPVRISLADQPREMNGLKFPHDIHLAAQGGAARMAISLGRGRGYGEPLTCSNCHTPNPDGIGFKPIEMEDNCESCHSLVFDRVGGIFRTLRHGDVAQMRAQLLAMDRAPRPPVATGRKRPGEFAQGGRYYSNFGRPGGSLVGVNRALAAGGVCGECHLPATKNGRPDVMPVNLPDRFLMHGAFSHDAHKEEECADCHNAEKSKTSEDLLLPGLAICRDCHLGEDAVKAEVPSSCAMCHSYHKPNGPAPKDHPDKRRDIVAILERMRQ